LLFVSTSAFIGIVMAGSACRGSETGSYVRVSYPCVPGAPPIDSLRVTWGVDKIGREKMEPGDEIAGFMEPGGGGGRVTVLLWIQGKQHVSERDVGERDDRERYGVNVALDPLGTAKIAYCRHPCSGSVQPWGEPWSGILASVVRPKCQ
jgi:hypothetical protein